jgi:hypothetical protein
VQPPSGAPDWLEAFTAAERPDWENWTQMAFPDDGEYVFPGGLAPLSVHGQTGSYWEPNVWMQHDV